MDSDWPWSPHTWQALRALSSRGPRANRLVGVQSPAVLPARRPALACLVATLAGACAGWHPCRTVPEGDLGFGVGARLGAPPGEAVTFAELQAAVGAARWWSGLPGGVAPFASVGGALVGVVDTQGARLGAEVRVVPPRGDHDAGLQARLTGTLSTDAERAIVGIGAEWAHWLAGALFAEARYDVLGEEGALLLGARVNLLYPVTMIRAHAVPMD